MIHAFFQTSFHSLLSTDIASQDFEVSLPPQGQEGDFAIACFSLAKKIGKNPADTASLLAEGLVSSEMIDSARAVGPFLNVSMSQAFFTQAIRDYTLPTYTPRDETIIVDYNQPNIGKPLHIAHLCTPSFGQPAINLLRYMGYTVYGDMHQGDWGGIFGKLIVAWEKW